MGSIDTERGMNCSAQRVECTPHSAYITIYILLARRNTARNPIEIESYIWNTQPACDT